MYKIITNTIYKIIKYIIRQRAPCVHFRIQVVWHVQRVSMADAVIKYMRFSGAHLQTVVGLRLGAGKIEAGERASVFSVSVSLVGAKSRESRSIIDVRSKHHQLFCRSHSRSCCGDGSRAETPPTPGQTRVVHNLMRFWRFIRIYYTTAPLWYHNSPRWRGTQSNMLSNACLSRGIILTLFRYVCSIID